jgi:hypothetical protein
MIVQDFFYSQSDLNTQSGIVSEITDVTLDVKGYEKIYKAQSIIVNNDTTDKVFYNFLTQEEYDKNSGELSDYIELESLNTDVINNIRDDIKYLKVQGNGSHTRTLRIEVIKEPSRGPFLIRNYDVDYEVPGSGVVSGFDSGFDSGFGV